MILDLDERVDDLVVEAFLGRGGAAEVYRVADPRQGRRFALKILVDRALTKSSRFSTEAGVLIQLRHPNIVPCYAFMVVKERPAMLLEYVDGFTLHTWAQTHGHDADVDLKWSILHGILDGVAYAHARDVLHRDLSSGNVILPREQPGTARILDFGLAKLLSSDAVVLHQTRSHVSMGTLGYIAPEQMMDAKRADARADLWSVGCLAYELFAGTPAFPQTVYITALNAAWRRGYAAIPADMPPGVAALVRACLDPDREKRPRDCAAARSMLG